MEKYWETNSFKDLKQTWYSKLEADGFKDAEKDCGDRQVLKKRSSDAYNQADQVVREAKENYYRQVAQRAMSEKFPRKADKVIMERHSEGWSRVKITAELRRLKIRLGYRTVQYTIRKYENLWNIKRWPKHKLTQNR
jgi:hypothetical protein